MACFIQDPEYGLISLGAQSAITPRERSRLEKRNGLSREARMGLNEDGGHSGGGMTRAEGRVLEGHSKTPLLYPPSVDP